MSVDLAPAFVQVDLDPVAVVLDFVEPLIPDRCLGFQGGELGLDESRHLRRAGAFDHLRL